MSAAAPSRVLATIRSRGHATPDNDVSAAEAKAEAEAEAKAASEAKKRRAKADAHDEKAKKRRLAREEETRKTDEMRLFHMIKESVRVELGFNEGRDKNDVWYEGSCPRAKRWQKVVAERFVAESKARGLYHSLLADEEDSE